MEAGVLRAAVKAGESVRLALILLHHGASPQGLADPTGLMMTLDRGGSCYGRLLADQQITASAPCCPAPLQFGVV